MVFVPEHWPAWQVSVLRTGVVVVTRCPAFGAGLFVHAPVLGSVPSIAALDVGLLHQGVLRPLLGIGPRELAAGELVEYSRDALEVEELVGRGDFDLGILTRAPTVQQVRAVADAGETMPQKSTYFWPKPASGLLMMLQPPGEAL